MHTKATLVKQLKDFGILPTDLLTVHTSLKAIGKIDDSCCSGAETLIRALCETVHDGILLIPSHTYTIFRLTPPGETPVYDVRNTMPCIGAVPCQAVHMANEAYDNGDPTCIRSMHPDHSVVAFGKHAADFVACDSHTATAVASNGCYAELSRHSGKILLIGVDLTCNTFIHYIDEIMDTAPRPYIEVDSIDYSGQKSKRLTTITKGASHTYNKYLKVLEEGGAVTYGKIGDADAILCDARKMFQIIVNTWDTLADQ